MITTLLEIPNAPSDWPGWLEQNLKGLHLHQLVSQLSLIAPENAADAGLMELFTDSELTQIAAQGLSILSQRQIGSLLSNPTAMYRLQERVLTEGGDYWQTVAATLSHQRRADAILQRVHHKLSGIAEDSNSNAVDSSSPEGPTAKRVRQPLDGTGGNKSRRAILLSLAVATVIGLGMWLMQPVPGPTWGFAKSDLENTRTDSSADYFNMLADAGQEWFKKSPENATQLRARLQTFSEGCKVLIEAPHSRLTATEREWLVAKCQAWKTRIDGLVVSLNADPDGFNQIQEDADDVVNRLVSALRAGPA